LDELLQDTAQICHAPARKQTRTIISNNFTQGGHVWADEDSPHGHVLKHLEGGGSAVGNRARNGEDVAGGQPALDHGLWLNGDKVDGCGNPGCGALGVELCDFFGAATHKH